MVLPLKTGGWLERHTMDVLRGRILQTLRKADVHDRLRVYYPQMSADTLAYLATAAGMVPIEGFTFTSAGSRYGNGLLSKLPISAISSI